jgi:hypothetical protein
MHLSLSKFSNHLKFLRGKFPEVLWFLSAEAKANTALGIKMRTIFQIIGSFVIAFIAMVAMVMLEVVLPVFKYPSSVEVFRAVFWLVLLGGTVLRFVMWTAGRNLFGQVE